MAENDGKIIVPEEKPAPPEDAIVYTHLLVTLRSGMGYIFAMSEEEMHDNIESWALARKLNEVFTVDTGPEGVWHLVAREVIFVKRITDKEAEEIRNNMQRQRLALAGLR